jgi:hypothetical protein
MSSRSPVIGTTSSNDSPMYKKGSESADNHRPNFDARVVAPVDLSTRGRLVNSKLAGKFRLLARLRLKSCLLQFLQFTGGFSEPAIPRYELPSTTLG